MLREGHFESWSFDVIWPLLTCLASGTSDSQGHWQLLHHLIESKDTTISQLVSCEKANRGGELCLWPYLDGPHTQCRSGAGSSGCSGDIPAQAQCWVGICRLNLNEFVGCCVALLNVMRTPPGGWADIPAKVPGLNTKTFPPFFNNPTAETQNTFTNLKSLVRLIARIRRELIITLWMRSHKFAINAN